MLLFRWLPCPSSSLCCSVATVSQHSLLSTRNSTQNRSEARTLTSLESTGNTGTDTTLTMTNRSSDDWQQNNGSPWRRCNIDWLVRLLLLSTSPSYAGRKQNIMGLSRGIDRLAYVLYSDGPVVKPYSTNQPLYEIN